MLPTLLIQRDLEVFLFILIIIYDFPIQRCFYLAIFLFIDIIVSDIFIYILVQEDSGDILTYQYSIERYFLFFTFHQSYLAIFLLINIFIQPFSYLAISLFSYFRIQHYFYLVRLLISKIVIQWFSSLVIFFLRFVKILQFSQLPIFSHILYKDILIQSSDILAQRDSTLARFLFINILILQFSYQFRENGILELVQCNHCLTLTGANTPTVSMLSSPLQQ